jgi:hypothetical protein
MKGVPYAVSAFSACAAAVSPLKYTSDARLNESRATKRRRQIHLR